MARKKSVSGRSRGVTEVNRIMLQTERINKALRRLEKAGRYGTYKSKELLEFVSRNRSLSVKKSRGSKRHRIVVNKLRLTSQERRNISQKFKEVLKSQAFTPSGIEKIEDKIRIKIKENLKGQLDREPSKFELEMFYRVLKYRKELDALKSDHPSEYWQLVLDAIAQGKDESAFLDSVKNYADLNNEEMRKSAQRLYEQLVVPYI